LELPWQGLKGALDGNDMRLAIDRTKACQGHCAKLTKINDSRRIQRAARSDCCEFRLCNTDAVRTWRDPPKRSEDWMTRALVVVLICKNHRQMPTAASLAGEWNLD
jgi:hypothetical protein